MNVAAITDALIGAGHRLDRRGWVPASGGNFSARITPAQILMTASGCHKGELTASDFLIVDGEGTPAESGRRASAETLLHCAIYRHDKSAGAVLHTHSVPATLLSRDRASVMLEGFELLKILDGITTHQASVAIPVFENDQNISRLAAVVESAFSKGQGLHGFLIRGHGLYAWGRSVAEARYRIEALEFLFDCVWQESTARRQETQ